MSDMIAAYIGGMSTGFFIRQVVVILMIFLFGYLLTAVAYGKRLGIYETLLSFPAGISAYSLAVFIMLILGIPFNVVSITVIILTISVLCLIVLARRSYFSDIDRKRAAIGIITVLCIAVISCSGLFPVSFSNDSLYYYHMYPKAIAHNGGLRMQFNVFLTDVGQTSAILNTLPFVYGFDEGFGIQMAMNINTLLIVIFALFEQNKRFMDKKRAMVSAAILTVCLICSMPYIVMSSWIMSNGYFMCFMFICIYTAWKNENAPIMGLMFLMMSLLRMEGCIAALILVLCFSTLRYSGKRLFYIFLLPLFAACLMYDAKIFLFMKIDAPYTFLTPAKAVIQFAALVIVSVYVLFIRDRLPEKVNVHMGELITAGLILVNLALFIYNRTLYVENARAFVHNLSDQSGWGLFPMYIIGVYIMSIIARHKERGYNETYWDLCFAAYMLTAIAVSFARDDALRESIADSGNRVMLQVTLIAFFAASMRVISLVNYAVAADNDSTTKITDQEENENGK